MSVTIQPDFPVEERVFLWLVTGFSVCLVLTNIVGIKLFQAPFSSNFALTTGILTYPLTFVFTDIVSELYGRRRADFMVLVGFVMSVLMLAIVQLAVAVPAHPYWVPVSQPYFSTAQAYQHAFESVFSLNSTLLFGSMLAYLVAQLVDNRLFHFWRRLTDGRHLWLRNNASTMVSQLLDTAIVNSILFFWGFGMDWAVGFRIMVTIYGYKLLLALLDTPLIYLGVYLIRDRLKVDPVGRSSC